MAKKLSRIIGIWISLEKGKVAPAAGAVAPDGWTKIGRVKAYGDSYPTTEIDDSDYDDGPDDSAVPGTRQGKISLTVNYDGVDPGQLIAKAMNNNVSGGITGSVLVRTENDLGQEEYASDAFVTQYDHAAASRQDMQGKSINLRLVGARRYNAVGVNIIL